MISLSHLNKFIYFTVFISMFIFNIDISIGAVDIWEKNKDKNEQHTENDDKKDFKEN